MREAVDFSETTIVRSTLEIIEPDGAMACEQLRQRFRKALLNANPDLQEQAMAIYDAAFSEQIPALAEASLAARVETAVQALDADQLAAWRRLLAQPDFAMFFASLRSIGPALEKSTQAVFAVKGVEAHIRSSERLFASMAPASAAGDAT